MHKSIESVIVDMSSLSAELRQDAQEPAALRVDAAIEALRGNAAELATWRQKAQASLQMGRPALDAERREADAKLRALGIDPNAVPADDDLNVGGPEDGGLVLAL